MMNMDRMRLALITLVKAGTGETCTPDKVVDILLRERVITAKRMRRALVRSDFFALMEAGGRTANDIELDLAAKYGIDQRTVQRMRSAEWGEGTGG